MTSLRRFLAWLSPDKAGSDEGAGPKGSSALKASAEKALRMKQEAQAEELARRPASQTPNEGMRPLPNTDIPPSGALGAEGNTPALSRSHGSRQGDGP